MTIALRIQPRPIHGILLLDKPIDITSNHALQKVKRLFNAKKAGHTGSLDPIATGMLPICFGEATKFSQYLLESNKKYFVTAQLGVETNTGDSEGQIVATQPVVDITRERIENVMSHFLGEIEQIPPMFSAIKHQGKPLYELARRGIEIERKPRTITLFSLTLDQLSGDQFTFHVHCSKGTYVRTLVQDMGRKLGCGAHVIGLRRETVTPYDGAEMYTLDALERLAHANQFERLTTCLLPVETSVQILPAIKLSASAAFYLRMGQSVRATISIQSPLVRLLADDGTFLGVGEITADGRVKPQRLVA